MATELEEELESEDIVNTDKNYRWVFIGSGFGTTRYLGNIIIGQNWLHVGEIEVLSQDSIRLFL